MAFTKDISRRAQFIAEVTLKYSDLTSAAELKIIDMPAGAVIDEAYLVLDTTFDPTTSAVIEVGISGATATFIASQNVFTGQTTGGRAGAATGKGYKFTAASQIVAKYTSGGGTATQGSARVVVAYHQATEADFWQA